MKRIVLLVFFLLLCGCAKEQPKMAGAKWAEALHHRDAKVRQKAAFTLGNIGPSDPAVLPALIGALKDVDAGIRYEAILALLKCGPNVREVVPVLTELRDQDRDAKVRTAAVKALETIHRSEITGR